MVPKTDGTVRLGGNPEAGTQDRDVPNWRMSNLSKCLGKKASSAILNPWQNGTRSLFAGPRSAA